MPSFASDPLLLSDALSDTGTDGFATAPDAPADYWGEIGREEFQELLDQLRHSHDFGAGVMTFFERHPRRDLYTYITDVAGRCAWHSLLAGTFRGGVAVDLGAGLGAISEGLCARHRQVYSIEGCRERCEFMALRKSLRGLQNQTIIHGPLHRLPLRDKSADLVVCNGVLEWAALARPGPVVRVQEEFLREAGRVLKDDGILYIGIENRFAKEYFRGLPDHSGLPYTSLLPRFFADLLVRNHKNRSFAVAAPGGGYRTYTYSARGYRRLLLRAGFANLHVACVNPSYDIPQHAFPWDGDRGLLNRFHSLFLSRRFRPWLDRMCCANFFLYAGRSAAPLPVIRDPLLFGYFDVSQIEGDEVRRTDLTGTVRNERIVNGVNALRAPQQQRLSTDQVAEAYTRFLATPNGRHAVPEPPPDLESLLAPLAADCLPPPALRRLLNVLQNMPREPLYHGDFWLGNLVIPTDPAALPVLLDAESHLFGSRLLDVADFCTDFTLHGRGRAFPAVNPEALCRRLGLGLPGKDLLLAAMLRQILRYSPHHRSLNLIYDYRCLLAACEKSVDPWTVLAAGVKETPLP